MKTTGKILAVKDDLIKVRIASQVNPFKVSDVIRIQKGAIRSLNQNSLLWVYYHWLIEEGGLKEQGFFSEQALHDDMKAYFLSSKSMKKGQFKAIEEVSTAELTKVEFGEYFEKVDMFMQDFFGLSTAPFWETYRDQYSMQ